MAVVLMTKRVVVAAGAEREVEVALAEDPTQRVRALVSIPGPPSPPGQLSHLEAWRLVRPELGHLGSPAIVEFFTRFMALVEDRSQHIYISPKHVAMALRQPARVIPAPVAVVPHQTTVPEALRAGELLLHMIPRLPGAPRDAWAYDLGLIASPSGFEICSLTLIRRDASIYGYPYGVFASVPEKEVLALGINDLGVNKIKDEVTGQGHGEALREILLAGLARTHEGDLVKKYADYDAARKARKRTPSNEVVVNLKTRHLIGICINVVELRLSRIGGKRRTQLVGVRADVANIVTAVQAVTGLVLPVYAYDYLTGVLTPLAALV